MTFMINKAAIVRVPVRVTWFAWGVKPRPTQKCLPCEACGSMLGIKPYGCAYVIEDGKGRNMRLCEACGIEAEKAVEAKL